MVDHHFCNQNESLPFFSRRGAGTLTKHPFILKQPTKNAMDNKNLSSIFGLDSQKTFFANIVPELEKIYGVFVGWSVYNSINNLSVKFSI